MDQESILLAVKEVSRKIRSGAQGFVLPYMSDSWVRAFKRRKETSIFSDDPSFLCLQVQSRGSMLFIMVSYPFVA